VSASEYIASFFLVIIGFAISELLKGSARLIRERHKIKLYWPYVLVVPFVFEILIFWFLWVFLAINDRDDKVWSVVEIIRISIPVIPWAFITYLIFPSRFTEGFDSKTFYLENGKIVVIIATLLNAYVLIEMLVIGPRTGMVTIIVSLLINIIVIMNFRRLHLIWLIATIVLVNYFIFVAKPLTI